MGHFTSIFVGVEMAQMVKAQVWYTKRLGSQFDNKMFLFQLADASAKALTPSPPSY